MVLKPHGAAQTPKTDPKKSGQTAFRYPGVPEFVGHWGGTLSSGPLVARGPGEALPRATRAPRPSKPYEFIGFGARDVTKPYKIILFGDMAPNLMNSLGFDGRLFRRHL